jgi:chorismate mutase/prephenate dehydratase
MPKTLAELRQQIDAVDADLLALLNRRAALANEVGEIKRIEGSPVFRPEREAQVINGLQTANPGPLKAENMATIWREVMSACRALEAPQRVAYLGPAGTFSEQAAVQFFGSSIQHVPCVSFDEVFHAATAGTAQFGVVPVENNTEGVVARSLDLFLNSPLHIVGESQPAGAPQPAALGQLAGRHRGGATRIRRRWLNARAGLAHLPHAERRAVSSNAEGARLASHQPGLGRHCQRARGRAVRPACGGPCHPGRGLQPHALRRGLPAADAGHAPQASGKDCVSLIVSVPNKPGAVHDILVPLKTHGVSMTRFESRPARSGQWEYYFYIDVQGHPSQPHVAAALQDLQSLCAFYKVLGTYPMGE